MPLADLASLAGDSAADLASDGIPLPPVFLAAVPLLDLAGPGVLAGVLTLAGVLAAALESDLALEAGLAFDSVLPAVPAFLAAPLVPILDSSAGGFFISSGSPALPARVVRFRIICCCCCCFCCSSCCFCFFSCCFFFFVESFFFEVFIPIVPLELAPTAEPAEWSSSETSSRRSAAAAAAALRRVLALIMVSLLLTVVVNLIRLVIDSILERRCVYVWTLYNSLGSASITYCVGCRCCRCC